jgi:hypothetical protein
MSWTGRVILPTYLPTYLPKKLAGRLVEAVFWLPTGQFLAGPGSGWLKRAVTRAEPKSLATERRQASTQIGSVQSWEAGVKVFHPQLLHRSASAGSRPMSIFLEHRLERSSKLVAILFSSGNYHSTSMNNQCQRYAQRKFYSTPSKCRGNDSVSRAQHLSISTAIATILNTRTGRVQPSSRSNRGAFPFLKCNISTTTVEYAHGQGSFVEFEAISLHWLDVLGTLTRPFSSRLLYMDEYY